MLSSNISWQRRLLLMLMTLSLLLFCSTSTAATTVLGLIGHPIQHIRLGNAACTYIQTSATWELGTPKGLSKNVLNSEVVVFLRFISITE